MGIITPLPLVGSAGNALISDGNKWATKNIKSSSAQAAAISDDDTFLTPSKLKDAFNTSSLIPLFACRAWVNFNGTGTVAIRDSGNVSSITDRGTGAYTVNFSTAMPDANYSIPISLMSDGASNVNHMAIIPPSGLAAGSAQVNTGFFSPNTLQDQTGIYVAVFR